MLKPKLGSKTKRPVSLSGSAEFNLGRASLRPFLIAFKKPGQDWTSSEVIKDARRKFDAGTHEMFQGRDGEYCLQYLRPRKVPTKPRSYFNGIV